MSGYFQRLALRTGLGGTGVSTVGAAVSGVGPLEMDVVREVDASGQVTTAAPGLPAPAAAQSISGNETSPPSFPPASALPFDDGVRSSASLSPSASPVAAPPPVRSAAAGPLQRAVGRAAPETPVSPAPLRSEARGEATARVVAGDRAQPAPSAATAPLVAPLVQRKAVSQIAPAVESLPAAPRIEAAAAVERPAPPSPAPAAPMSWRSARTVASPLEAPYRRDHDRAATVVPAPAVAFQAGRAADAPPSVRIGSVHVELHSPAAAAPALAARGPAPNAQASGPKPPALRRFYLRGW